MRGVLHHSCNSVLGKVENAIGRFGLSGHYIEWAAGLAAYLLRHKNGNVTGLIYPTHKTEEEKKLVRAKKARVARANKKAVKA